jgi:hypothetical protein
MEARFFSAALIAAAALSLGANYRTQNFLISAATPQLAREIGDAGEVYRRDLAQEWLGRELPPWHEPCPVTAQVSPNLGAGGATSFMFDHGRPFGWRMTIQGSRERLLDSVLPHEVTHMIFATHFGRPLPRWADEGACTTVEHISEKSKQQHLLITFLTSGRGIAFNQMFAMKEYPRDILPLYAQGYSLARYLIDVGGRRKFVDYVAEGMNTNNWTAATQKHYGIKSLSELQITWLEWVRRGSPLVAPATTLVAAAEPPANTTVAAEGSIRPVAYTATQTSPDTALVAQTASTDGWYARQRDLARSTRVSGAPPATHAVSDPEAEPAVRSSVTRPHDIGTPAPTVLQWSNLPSGVYAPPPAPVAARAPILQYDAAPLRRY